MSSTQHVVFNKIHKDDESLYVAMTPQRKPLAGQESCEMIRKEGEPLRFVVTFRVDHDEVKIQ